MKTIKRILIAPIVIMLAIGFNVVPALAYIELKTPVSITATGTLAGQTESFTVDVVKQSDGSGTTLVFETPSGVHDSEEALKIKGGTNEVDARIVVYTDNDSNTGIHNVPTVDPETGIDGSGLVGQANAGFSVALCWGAKSAADNDPNTRENYTGFTAANLEGGVHAVYIVDTRHTRSFCPTGDPDNLDTQAMFKLDGTPVPNPATEGPKSEKMYPQLWDEDLYGTNPVTDPDAVVKSEALFKNIATVAFGLAHDGTNYVCRVPNLTTPTGDDNIAAKLGIGAADGLYIYIGADFRGKPAQTYSTEQLNLAIVQD